MANVAATSVRRKDDYEGGGQICRATVTISAAKVKAANGAPVILVECHDDREAIEYIDASQEIETYGGAAYATNTTAQIITDTADVPHAELAKHLEATAALRNRFVPTAIAAANVKQVVWGKNLLWKVKTGEAITGTSVVVVDVLYRRIRKDS